MIDHIKRIVIAGAGIMGSSMAWLFAAHGYEVALYDISEEAIARSRELVRINQEAAPQAENTIRQIVFTCEKECFRNVDFVIEAVIEKIAVKNNFWNEISVMVPETAVLSSNTSGLSLTQIAETVKKPERFCGMHWLNPPHIYPLVEIIKGEKTSESTMDIVYRVAQDIGRLPVKLKKEVPGFLVNRFQFAILREAMSLVESGVCEKEDVDKVFKYGLGLRYACRGPFEIADLGGLDTFYSIAEYLFADISDAKQVPRMLAELYENGDYGVKTGRGFYDYSEGRGEEAIKRRDRDFLKVSRCLYGDLH